MRGVILLLLGLSLARDVDAALFLRFVYDGVRQFRRDFEGGMVEVEHFEGRLGVRIAPRERGQIRCNRALALPKFRACTE